MAKVLNQPPVDSLTAAIQAEAYEQGLTLALTRWGKTRAPSLAALVDRLSERAGPRAPEVVTYDFAVAKLSLAADMVGSCARLPPDPRVAARLTQMLLAPPFTSLGSRGLWTPLLELLGDHHADPRTLDALAPVAASYAGIFGATRMGEQMQRGVQRLVEKLRGRFAATVDDDEAKALLARFPVDAPKPAPKPTSGDDLLAAIYQDPDDDQLRQVYADWLLDRGDPRGEFIALQFRAHRGETLSETDAKREASLRKKHMKDWLGPLYGVTRKDDNGFARGFLDRCVFQPRHPAMVAATDHPSWATVREIQVENGGTNDSGESLIARPVMRRLRVLRQADGPLLEALLECRDFELTTLHVAWFGSRRASFESEKVWSAFLETSSLARLRRLELGHWRTDRLSPARFAQLFASPLATRLDEVVVDDYYFYNIADEVLGALRAAPPALKLTFMGRIPAYARAHPNAPKDVILKRGADGAYVRVDPDAGIKA